MAGYVGRARISDVFPYVVRHLADNEGNHDANVDGSVEPVVFKLRPPTTGIYVVTELVVNIEASQSFRTNTYGSLPQLTNGLRIGYFDDETNAIVEDITAEHPIRKNVDWAMYAFPVELNSWGGGNSHLTARWSLGDVGTKMIVQAGSNLAIGVEIRDDLSSLVTHEFVVHGYSRGVS